MHDDTVLIIEGTGEPEVLHFHNQESVVLLTSTGLPGPPGPPGPAGGEVILQQHIENPTPHPAYDDIPDLSLLFDNGLL